MTHPPPRTNTKSTTAPCHTMTREDIIDKCGEVGGVHVLMLASHYDVIYECVSMATPYTKAEAIAAAHTLANDHEATNNSPCAIYDYTATPITEEDLSR